VRVTVHDSGIGLDPQAQDRIFDALTHQTRGMGMGLSISRTIVENHGGGYRRRPGRSWCDLRVHLPAYG